MRWPLIAGLAAIGMLAAAAFAGPRLFLNVSASAPPGLYLSLPQTKLKHRDLVVLRPDPGVADALARYAGYPRDVPIIKHIAALDGDTVCRVAAMITVNGAVVAHARDADGVGRALPAWRGCIQLAHDQVFLLGSHPESFDSRYFGLVSSTSILGRARKL